MRKNKALFALLAGVVAAALFAVPATAMAETVDDDGAVHLTQADFNPDDASSFYVITDSRTYVLDDDVKGRIKFTSEGKIDPTLDLNSHELTGVGDSAILCRTVYSGTVTIKNGALSQSNERRVIYVDAGVLEVRLENVNVSATNAICVQVEATDDVYISGGTYTTTNTKEGVDEPVLCAGGQWGRINVTSGDFNLVGGTTIVKRDNTADTNYIKIAPDSASSGITFSSFPSQATIADDYSLLKTKGGSYEVVSSSSDKVTNAYWKVAGVTNFDTVYFEDGDEAKAFAAEEATRTATQLRAVVTFDPANGDDPVERVVAVNGTAAGQVEDPVKADGVFKYWSADGKTDFDIEHTPITGDTKLTAVYGEAVATNGTEGYASLQEAINDNGHEASTVTLLKDITESVSIYQCVALTINLGGKTLTSEDGCDGIILSSKGTLTITNGSVKADGDCLYVNSYAAGSTVNLASEGELSEGPLYFSKLESDEDLDFCGAVYVCGGAETTTLNIMGGSYESAGYYAIYVEGDVTLNVTDGQFSNGLKDEDYSTITAEDGSNVEFAGERVSDHILLDSTSTATVHSGKFGDATNAGDVVEGKYLYKGNKEYYEGKDEYYEVLDYEDALDASDYVVYNEDFSTRVYFATYEDAKAYAASIGDESVIVNLYHVPFLVKGEQYYYHTYEVGEEIGELPEAPEFEDYTFAGWYVNGEKIDSTYKVNDDITVVAMWYWNGSSDEEPTDNPEAKGNKKLPQTGDPAMAVSGIAAAGAALAGIGALRRRK